MPILSDGTMPSGNVNELPLRAREELQVAARTPITPGDPFARVRAIDRVTERLRAQYPECFQPNEG